MIDFVADFVQLTVVPTASDGIRFYIDAPGMSTAEKQDGNR